MKQVVCVQGLGFVGAAMAIAIALAEDEKGDAIEQLMRIIKEPLTEKETLNLGTESPEVTILEVSEICHATVGRKVLIKAEPATPGSPQRRGPSMIKTNSLIKYSSQINLKEGILRTYKWYYENIFNNPKISS